MAGALLFSSKLDDPVAWSTALKAAMPELDVRVSPELGDLAGIETALVWKAPPGELASLPNLKLITNLGAGVDPILADPTIPPHIPVARLGDEVMAQMMAQFVTMCVLRHYRDLARYERQHRERRWHYVLPTASYDCRVGVMGIGLLGGAAARMLAGIGFPVAGWGRSPRTVEGVETYHGRDGLAPFLARTDILVCLLPLTGETRHVVGREVLYGLPRGAKLINCGRGGTVNETALLKRWVPAKSPRRRSTRSRRSRCPPSTRSGAWSRCSSCRISPRSRFPRSPPAMLSTTSDGCALASRSSTSSTGRAVTKIAIL